MLYERGHPRRLAEYGGLWKQMPVFSALFLIITMGSAGLPGLSGFIGEFLTLFGTFNAEQTSLPMPRLLGALAATGVILGAVYLLYMFQKVFFGKLDKTKNGNLPDMSDRELVVFLPLIAGIFILGVAPRPMLRSMEKSVDQFVTQYQIKVAEPDGPAHLQGHAVTPVAAAGERETGNAPVAGGAARQLGQIAAQAGEVERTLEAARPVPTAARVVGGAP